MKINMAELDYSSYKLPYDLTEEELKQILKLPYGEAIQLTEDDLVELINTLRKFIYDNECIKSHKEEYWMVSNMECHFRIALAVVKGELEGIIYVG